MSVYFINVSLLSFSNEHESQTSSVPNNETSKDWEVFLSTLSFGCPKISWKLLMSNLILLMSKYFEEKIL